MGIPLQALSKSRADHKQSDNIIMDQKSAKDIAIIGISCRFGGANNKDEYWKSLIMGDDHIRAFPEHRKKLNDDYLSLKHISEKDSYYQAGFLDQVDAFDYELFSISPLEASLMSPNQRLFLQAAWESIDDAGYGGALIRGSRTGVFLGYSTDFGVSYKELIETSNPSLSSMSISANLHSIIASRISYLLDLKGPSVVVDTACSSSLVAIHQACRSIRNGECEMAIAGSVKVDILPLTSIKAKEDEIGITSPDSRARTFDDSSEGTGLGEGVAAIMIKSLSKAIEDGDHIYAVIKGSAINQDGASAGLTAPNPTAQEEVIERAWKNAGIDPETITYIEAHGTGTNLGDPIEITGIDKAFSKYTDKKQFCAIGSVKTNLGHLDHAAGMAGIIKAILALKYKEIPPSLHFQKPNRKISFENYQVYVNDRLSPWATNGFPRRCGISSFGLSGTNCHIILEEALPTVQHAQTEPGTSMLLSLSAKRKEGVIELIHKYKRLLLAGTNLDLQDLCFTANVGREHFSHRLAIVFNDRADLLASLEKAANSELSELKYSYLAYGDNRIVSDKQLNRNRGELTRTEQVNLTQVAQDTIKLNPDQFYTVAEFYIAGADIDWRLLYRGQQRFKLSLPAYPFAQTSCWIEADKHSKRIEKLQQRNDSHPLYDTCLSESFDRVTYLSRFTTDDYWILNEHIVAGKCVAPGTVYLEMAVELALRYYPNQSIQLTDVMFISPLTVDSGEIKSVQTIVTEKNGIVEFVIMSKSKHSNRWIKHSSGRILHSAPQQRSTYSIKELKESCSGGELKHYPYLSDNRIETGPRWDCVKETSSDSRDLLVYLSLDEAFHTDLLSYHLHPALMDEAVNVALRSVGEDLYLPFSYKSIKIYGPLPANLYSYIKRKDKGGVNPELATFDVILLDEFGMELVVIEDYSIKRVSHDLGTVKQESNNQYFQLDRKKADLPEIQFISKHKSILVIKDRNDTSDEILKAIQGVCSNVIEIELSSDMNQYDVISDMCASNTVTQIINLMAFSSPQELESVVEFENQQQRDIYSLYHLTRALVNRGLDRDIDLVLIAPSSDKSPHHASLFGLGRVVDQENRNIKCRCIDVDSDTDVQTILREITNPLSSHMTAYRSGERFVNELQRVNLTKYTDRPIDIVTEGVYIITGGTGGLGLEIAKYLAAHNRIHIACINRSLFPPEEDWDQLLISSTDEKLKGKINLIRNIQSTGSKIHLYSADVSSMVQMSVVFNQLREQYGQIRGVIHAAGVAGDGFIIRKDLHAFQNVLSPKTLGTFVLDKLTENDNLDFFVLFSSITSFLAGQGQGDYTAANAYLDAFSLKRNQQGKRTLSINWPAWEEVGMAFDYGTDRNSDMFVPIPTEAAIKAFDTVLHKEIERIIIGELNDEHPSLYDNSLGFELGSSILLGQEGITGFGHQQEENDNQTTDEHTNVTLLGRTSEDPYTDIEISIARVMGKTLGLIEINIYDSFLELGGNSILAVKVEVDMEKANIPISIIDLYEHQNVRELAEFIMHKSGQSPLVQRTEAKVESTSFSTTELSKSRGDTNHVLSGIAPFNEVFYKDCFHNSLFPIIPYFGQSLDSFSKNDLFLYESNGMINLFAKSIQDILLELGIGVKSKTHISSQQQEPIATEQDIELLELFARRIGMIREEAPEGIQELIPSIKSALREGRPVIVWVDCFYESIRKDSYHKVHWMHSLVVYGYDDELELFHIIEHNYRENLTYSERTISYQDLYRSYEGFLANYLPYVNMPTYYEFYSMDESSKLEKINNQQAFIDNWSGYQEQIVTGMEQARLFIDKYQLLLFDETELKREADGLILILNSIIASKQIEMFNIKTLFGNECVWLHDIELVISHWNYIRQMLIKYSYTSSFKMGNLSERLQEIYPLEQKFYSELMSFMAKEV